MKKIIALGGSNSKKSINKRLAVYAAKKVENVEVVVLDLNDFDIPLYGIDLENEQGIPEDAKRFNEHLEEVDAMVVSLAEHNGSYATAFKNVYDWLSRIDKKVWKEKPMLLMATSPGERGASMVLNAAKGGFPFMGAEIVASFSLPSFDSNFSEDGIRDKDLNQDLNLKIVQFQEAIFS